MPSSRVRSVLAATAVVVAVAALYSRTLTFDFLWDDHLQIEQNPWLYAPDGLARAFTRPSWGFQQDAELPAKYYRPLFLTSYALLARGFGATPASFHAAALGLHALVALLVGKCAARLCASGWAGVVAALLFAVHPAQAEAVAWVAVLGDLLCALFVLLALLGDSAARARAPLVFLGSLAACLSKETGVGLVAVLGVAAFLHVRGSSGRPRDWLRRMAPALSALALYFALRWHALGACLPARPGSWPSWLEPLLLAAVLLVSHVRLWFWPFGLEPQLFARAAQPGLVSVTLGTGLALFALVLIVRRRSPPAVALGTACALALLLPVLDAAAVGRFNFAERYAYLPLIGVAWLAGWASLQLRARVGGSVAALVAATGLAACALTTRTKLETYRDDAAYFKAAVRVAGQVPEAQNGLGIVLERAGDLEGAERAFRRALEQQPGLVVAWTNLGGVLERRGDLKGALLALEHALALDPRSSLAGVRLARLHRALGNGAAALRLLDDLLARGLVSDDVLLERALLALDGGEPRLAERLLRRALSRLPGNPRGFYLLAQALYSQERLTEAEQAARSAIERGAGAGPRRLLALLRAREGQRSEALELLAEAERLAPGDPANRELRLRLTR